MQILGKLFGSEAKVKIMRLFLCNPEMPFDIKSITQKSKVKRGEAKKETAVLEKAGFLKKKSFFMTILKKKGKQAKKRVVGYILDQDFSYRTALRDLLTSGKAMKIDKIISKLSKAGKLKLVILSGIFIQSKNSRLDILVVGDNLNKSVLNNVIRSIEAEIGREILYAFFETPDFKYRLGMYDKLIRDVIDFPHQVILDKINI